MYIGTHSVVPTYIIIPTKDCVTLCNIVHAPTVNTPKVFAYNRTKRCSTSKVLCDNLDSRHGGAPIVSTRDDYGKQPVCTYDRMHRNCK